MRLGDPPVRPLPDPHRVGKGDSRRAAQISAELEARRYRRMQVKCPGCGWLGLRGSVKCCKCGHKLLAGKKEK